MSINIENLTIKQKADLIQTLTTEIIKESQSDNFKNKSDNNKRISGIFNTFAINFNSNARSVVNFLKESD